MQQIKFDEARHEYRTESGLLVPSVTQIIGKFYPLPDCIDADLMARAQAFGTAVHKCIDWDARGELDESTVDAAIVPYLDAARWFQSQHGKVSGGEAMLFSEKMFCAGITDGMCGDILVDWKTGKYSHPLQTAGYYLMLPPAQRKLIKRRAAVHLFESGAYTILWHTDPADVAAFQAAASLYNYMQGAK